MTHLSVTNKIDHDVTLEFLTVLGRDGEHFGNVVHGVRVDVEDRRLDGFGEVCAVDSRAGLIRAGCETNLVVHHDVDSTSYFVAGKVSHLHGFIDNSLSSKGGITVDQEGHYSFTLFITNEMLLSASATQYYWVNCLKMRWVSEYSLSECSAIWICFGKCCA